MKSRAHLLVSYVKKFVNCTYSNNISNSIDSILISGGIDFVQRIYFDCLGKDISNDIQEPKPENEIERDKLLPGDIVFIS